MKKNLYNQTTRAENRYRQYYTEEKRGEGEEGSISQANPALFHKNQPQNTPVSILIYAKVYIITGESIPKNTNSHTLTPKKGTEYPPTDTKNRPLTHNKTPYS